MGTLKSQGNIFLREKKRKLRLPKARWIIGGFIVAFVIALFAMLPTQATKVIQAQNFDANHWWNKDDCNGSEANYHCRAQDAYPVTPVEPIDPIPTLRPEDPYPAPSDGYTTNPAGLQQASSSIIQLQQQIQTQMASFVQKRNQAYNQLVTQYRQYHQLKAQLDAINDAYSRSTDERRTDALQRQSDTVQQNIDRLDETIVNTQEQLDDTLYDCRQKIDELQARQDELETNMADQFSRFLDYQIPDYPYNP
jgi:hypothetical protein